MRDLFAEIEEMTDEEIFGEDVIQEMLEDEDDS